LDYALSPTSSMNILFLAHRTPYPPNKGEKIRSYHILSRLAQTHFVSLVYWLDDPDDVKHAATLHDICRGEVVPVRLNRSAASFRGLISGVSGKSFSEGYFYSHRFQRIVDEILSRQRYDIVYVFSSVMAQYVRKAREQNCIVDYVDVDSDKWGQLGRFQKFPWSKLFCLEQRRLGSYELAVSRWAKRILFVSRAEVDLFKAMGAEGQVSVLPNGIDVARASLGETTNGRRGELHSENSKPVRILFVGTMNYYPNSDAVLYFVQEVFPLVRQHYPNAIFEIAGRFPPKSVCNLQKVQGVRVLGEVAEVGSLLGRADVSVAPIRIARGVQNKVLEAMAAGVPVVATSEAIRGIEVRDGDEVLVGDDSKTFATQILRVLSDSELREGITHRARCRLLESYSWKNIGFELERLIVESAGQASQELPMQTKEGNPGR